MNGTSPDHWKEFSVGDVFDDVGGGTPSKENNDYWGGEIPWISSADISEDNKITPERYITKEGVANSSTTVVPKGTLIIVTRVGLGKIGIAPCDLAFNQDCRALKYDENEVHPRFAMYYFEFRESELKMKGRGTTVNGITVSELRSLPYVSPAIEEQQRIVAKIEELFSKLDSGISELEEGKQRLEKYRKAILKQAIWGELTEKWRQNHGELTNPRELLKQPSEYSPPDGSDVPEVPDKWILATFDDVFEVYLGSTPKRSNDEYWNGDINWISSGEVEFSRIKDSDEKITRAGLESCSTTVHPPNTVMLGIIGQGKTRGRAAILDIEAAHNQNTVAIRPGEAGIPAEYIYYFFMQNYERTRRLGSGNQQKALSKTRVQNMVFPLPPVEEQRKISELLDQSLSTLEKVEQSVKENTKRSNHLRQSILKHAFKGDLIPQEPTEEPPTPDGGNANFQPGEQTTLSEVISDVE